MITAVPSHPVGGVVLMLANTCILTTVWTLSMIGHVTALQFGSLWNSVFLSGWCYIGSKTIAQFVVIEHFCSLKLCIYGSNY